MRRGRKGNSETRALEEARDMEEEEVEVDEGRGFFACYLLCSLSPRHKGHTYIGFTVNPRRRIKQHNGEMRSGAWRTKRGRPWEMILCIYGFPSNVTALQFEWAWQHPRESLAVRKAASSFKSLSGIANKIKLAYTMLLLPSWENLKLTVNFFSTKYMKYTSGCPRLPKQMRVSVCVMDELPCYVEGQTFDSSADDDVEDEDQEVSDINADEIKGDTDHFTRESINDLFDWTVTGNFRELVRLKESCCLVAPPDPTDVSVNQEVDDAHRAGSDYSDGLSSRSDCDDLEHRPDHAESLNQRNNCSRTSYSKTFRPPMPRSCDYTVESSDSLLLSLEGNMIDLSTPPSCKIHYCSKKDRANSGIVDLTDSPVIIQL